jgi:glycerol-3-phosphate dehydrogenase (NAD(P)+)
MQISVLGCGRWGTFIAWYLHRVGHTVSLWGREGSTRMEALVKTRRNPLIDLPEEVSLTTDLNRAVQGKDAVIISIAAQGLRALMGKMKTEGISPRALVLCMKGIEENTGLRLTEVVAEYTPAPTAIWVGPGHVQDFVAGIPNCMVIDSNDDQFKQQLVHSFSSELIRFYFGTDLIGNEVGAAAKNVIGIAAGMLDGVDRSSLKGALMSRGTREIARLIQAMGGNEISAYGLCHLGDYEATLFSEYSHNRRFGERFIRGEPYGELAEGVSTTRALVKLGDSHGVDLPICQAVDRIVNFGADPWKVLSSLFLRSLKEEF